MCWWFLFYLRNFALSKCMCIFNILPHEPSGMSIHGYANSANTDETMQVCTLVSDFAVCLFSFIFAGEQFEILD